MFSYVIYKMLLWIFGLYSIYKIFLFLKYVNCKLFMPLFWKQIDYKTYGQWAVITGCTDGIGKAFTFELAKLGLDLVLISRSEDKLNELDKELKEKYDVKTKIIVADFKNTSEVIPKINKELNEIDIGLLINNVGTALPRLIGFVNNKKDKINDMVEVNIKSALFMCSVVLNCMLKKRKGVIINIASLLSFMPSPGASVYGATKAFILKFSKDLHDEYKKDGIIVHCLTTGPVVTKLFNVKISKWITPTPEIYAKSALKNIGMCKVTTGYSSHDLIEFIFNALEEILPTLFLTVALKIVSVTKIFKNK